MWALWAPPETIYNLCFRAACLLASCFCVGCCRVEIRVEHWTTINCSRESWSSNCAFTFHIIFNGQAAGLQIVSRRASAVVLTGLKCWQSDGYHLALDHVFDSNIIVRSTLTCAVETDRYSFSGIFSTWQLLNQQFLYDSWGEWWWWKYSIIAAQLFPTKKCFLVVGWLIF